MNAHMNFEHQLNHLEEVLLHIHQARRKPAWEHSAAWLNDPEELVAKNIGEAQPQKDEARDYWGTRRNWSTRRNGSTRFYRGTR